MTALSMVVQVGCPRITLKRVEFRPRPRAARPGLQSRTTRQRVASIHPNLRDALHHSPAGSAWPSCIHAVTAGSG